VLNSSLHLLDWLIIGLFLCGSIGISVYFSKRATKNIQAFYLSGRSLTWYIAGFSLIATTFAADTPLWVTSLVRKFGVYYLWQYWAPVIGASLAVVLFSRYWRRVNVETVATIQSIFNVIRCG
jgi:solute:Na+ symporter, SSS family